MPKLRGVIRDEPRHPVESGDGPDDAVGVAFNGYLRAPIRYRCVPLRMKIDPPDTAIEASVAPSSPFVATLRNSVPGAITVATPSSLKK